LQRADRDSQRGLHGDGGEAAERREGKKRLALKRTDDMQETERDPKPEPESPSLIGARESKRIETRRELHGGCIANAHRGVRQGHACSAQARGQGDEERAEERLATYLVDGVAGRRGCEGPEVPINGRRRRRRVKRRRVGSPGCRNPRGPGPGRGSGSRY
jgi:hypothetical protein